MTEIYLDNNATTQLTTEVKSYIKQLLEKGFGNPSSSHSLGKSWRSIIELARQNVASLINAQPSEIFFTSSGTESNNWALNSLSVNYQKKIRIITSSIEHPSVLNACKSLEAQGHLVKYLPVGLDGIVDIEKLEKELETPTDFVSIQWVNNETGTTQPVYDMASLCRNREVPFHTDAVQALGKLDVNLNASEIQYASFSAHKIHGLSGVGALYIKQNNPLLNYFQGGSQERGKRPGTENSLGIASFGEACRVRRGKIDQVIEYVSLLKSTFYEELISAGVELSVNGSASECVSNCINLHFPQVEVGALVARADKRGVIFSQNSACHGQSIEASHVLRAMGNSAKNAWSSARFSFSEINTVDEIKTAAQIVAEEISIIKTMM